MATAVVVVLSGVASPFGPANSGGRTAAQEAAPPEPSTPASPSAPAEVDEPSDRSTNEPQAADRPGGRAEDRRKAKLSGRIVLEDGTPSAVKGWMHYDSDSESGSSSGLGGQKTAEFAISVPAGTVSLSHYAEGFAPAWAGPFEMKPGETVDDVVLVLTTGTSKVIQVSDEQGRPVAGATLVAHPEINGSADGPIKEHRVGADGQLTLNHLADTRYAFYVAAPRFETLRTDPLEIQSKDKIDLTMSRSRPATGTVRNADGSPAAEATLRARYAANADGGGVGFANSGDGFWGEIFTATDEQGKFTLDQLSAGSHYLFIIEGSDGARAIVHDLRAGLSDVEIELPARHDLFVEIQGDTSGLPRRQGKPYIRVRQRIEFEAPGGRYSDLVGDDVAVEVKETGGTAVLRGLAIDWRPNAPVQQVEVSLGRGSMTTKTVPLSTDGRTRVEFVLDARESEANR